MRLLIVEDEAITAMVLTRQLEHLGYSVIGTAASGEQACALASTHGPDAIVMDIGLAGRMDGIDAAVHIRRDLSAPIVFASGYNTPEIIERTCTIPNSAFIGKPTDPQKIHELFQRFLDGDNRKDP
jgi:CheY-like chemotaxis protein